MADSIPAMNGAKNGSKTEHLRPQRDNQAKAARPSGGQPPGVGVRHKAQVLRSPQDSGPGFLQNPVRPFSANDTAPLDTPARAATSGMVGFTAMTPPVVAD